jgi:hypothetical protein
VCPSPDSTPQLLRQDTCALIAAALAASGFSELAAADALEALDVPGAPLTRPFAGAEALLAELKQLGLRVVVVSNAFFRTRAGYCRDFEQLGVGGCIDDILSSVDTGVRKPNPEMFRLALAAPVGCENSDSAPDQRFRGPAIWLRPGPDTCFVIIVWPHRTPWFISGWRRGITSWGGPRGSGLVNNCPVGRGVATLPGRRDVSLARPRVGAGRRALRKPAGHAADRNECTLHGEAPL